MTYETMEKIKITPRVQLLRDNLFESTPQIESDRARLLTESYKMTEHLPVIKRRSHAFRHILENIPITIREAELVVGSATKKSRSCQTFPEYSFEWLEEELDTIATRSADPFYISEEDKKTILCGKRYKRFLGIEG